MRKTLVLLCAACNAFAATVPPLAETLRRAGKAAEEFWTEFPAVNCTESVTQVKLGGNGKPVYAEKSSFDYLIVLQSAGDEVTVEESRMPLKTAPEKKAENVPLLVTNGFSTFLLVFHPLYQDDFEFSQPALDQVDGMTLVRVEFRHRRGARSPSVLQLRQREYPVEWQGTAWLDPESGAIVRMSAGLGTSMADVGLKALTADVRYARFTFKEQPGEHWLPVSATIEAETPRQHWRNVHTFSGYKQFSVTTKTEVNAPK